MNGTMLLKLLVSGVAISFNLSTYATPESVREGLTAQDRRFVAGGIGLDESGQMKSMARDFPLAITVATKSGEYLADSHIRIQDARGKLVLETQLDAPYLLVDLGPGAYTVEATLQGKKLQQDVEINASSRSRVVFTFDGLSDQAPGQLSKNQR